MTIDTGERVSTVAKPGLILRRLRIEKGLTQTDLSERTGLPISTVSKVELGKMSLTYDKLARISEGLGVDIAQIFGNTKVEPPEDVSNHGIRSITRANGGGKIDARTYEYVYHATDLRQKKVTPLLGEIKARSIEEFGDLIRHEGDEYTYVLEGALEFHSDLYTLVILEAGDSIYFDSAMGHAYIKVGSAPCRVLSVCAGERPAAGEHRPVATLEVVRADESTVDKFPSARKPSETIRKKHAAVGNSTSQPKAGKRRGRDS